MVIISRGYCGEQPEKDDCNISDSDLIDGAGSMMWPSRES